MKWRSRRFFPVSLTISGATPETIKIKNSEWTDDMRKRVVGYLEKVGMDGLPVPETNYNVAYKSGLLMIISKTTTIPVCYQLGN